MKELELKILFLYFVSSLSDEEKEKILGLESKFISSEMNNILTEIKKRTVKKELIDATTCLEPFVTKTDIETITNFINVKADDLDGYIHEIKKNYAVQILKQAKSNSSVEDIEELMSEAQKVLDNNDVKETMFDMETCVKMVYEHFDKDGSFLKTGWKNFDANCPIEKTDLVIIAGRPAMAKTATALSLALGLLKNGNRGILFSLEMSVPEIMSRLLSQLSAVEYCKLRNKDTFTKLDNNEMGRISVASSKVAKINKGFEIASGTFTWQQIRNMVKKKKKYGLDFIIVDYIQLVRANSKNKREEQVAEVSRELKSIALDFNVCVISLAQLSRAVESRADKRPELSDLRESGQLEQDASVVVGLYRDEYYNENTEYKGLLELGVLKNRKGRIGVVPMKFIGEIQLVKDIKKGEYK